MKRRHLRTPRRVPENGDFNQYWYSAKTIEALVAEVEENSTKAAFLSTPSILFSLPRVRLSKEEQGSQLAPNEPGAISPFPLVLPELQGSAVRAASYVFDLDEQFSKGANYVR